MNARKIADGGAQIAAPRTNAKEDRHFVTALARGLEVLSCFGPIDRQLGNQEIAQRCKLPKSTVSRLTYTLTKIGYLHHSKESSKYRLGTASMPELGNAMLALLEVRRKALLPMQALADFSRGMVALGMRDRFSMVHIEHCRGESAPLQGTDAGARISLAGTAMGRACLAVMAEDERRNIMLGLREQDEESWPDICAGIENGLNQYREFGCSGSFGDGQQDVNAIAVAFRPGGGLPLLSVCCIGPVSHLEQKFLLDEVRPKLIDLVRQLESSPLGGGVET